VCDKSEEKKILQDLLNEIEKANLQIIKSNENNKYEREKLSKMISELKQTNENTVEELKQVKEENNAMKNVIEELMKQSTEKKTREIEERDKQLRRLGEEMEELKKNCEFNKKHENQKDNKHNLTNQPAASSPFQSKEELMTGGFENFVENNNNRLAIPNTSYEEWYRDISTRLRPNIPCLFEKYIFMKVKFNEKYSIVRWNSHRRDDNDKLKVTISYCSVKTCTYNEQWDHEHIKYNIILHPKESNKALELELETCKDDYNGFMTDKATEDYYSVKNELILCCKKR